jgi:hypothetical protein
MKTSLNFREKPFAYLLLSSVIWIIIIVAHPLFGLTFQDKLMFSFPLKSIIWIFPVFLFFLGLLYQATRKFLYSDTLISVHVLTTVLTSMGIIALLFKAIAPVTPLSKYPELIGLVMQWLSVIFVLSQLFYLINLVLGVLITKKK